MILNTGLNLKNLQLLLTDILCSSPFENGSYENGSVPSIGASVGGGRDRILAVRRGRVTVIMGLGNPSKTWVPYAVASARRPYLEI